MLTGRACDAAAQVGAFDLKARVLLWRRLVATRGLLNVVSAPHLSEASTSVATPAWPGAAVGAAAATTAKATAAATLPQRRSIIDAAGREVPVRAEMPYELYDPASGVPPRQIRLADKQAAARLPPSRLPAAMTGTGAYVPLAHIDVRPLAAALAAHPEVWDPAHAAASNAVLGGRDQNMARFKPGCGTVHFIFSDQSAAACFHFPWWDEWKPLVQPIVSEILSWYGVPAAERESRAVRLQLARMAPGGAILQHSDKGGWATGLHRIHIPIVTNPGTRFLMQADATGAFVPVHVAPGDVFEINNVIPHLVQNSPDEERIHLLLDWSEETITCGQLTAGQRCEYANAEGIKC